MCQPKNNDICEHPEKLKGKPGECPPHSRYWNATVKQRNIPVPRKATKNEGEVII